MGCRGVWRGVVGCARGTRSLARMDDDEGQPARASSPGLTGERTLPGIWHENYWFRRHEVAYRWLTAFARGRWILEAGCGEGYGAQALVDAGARLVVAVDYDAATVAHVRHTYPGVRVVRGNLVALPLPTGAVDVVVSLQTVEHLWDQPGFVAECARVCSPLARLILSTPNRLTFSPGVGRGEKPLNPFHVNELDAEELADLVRPQFTVDELLGVHHGPRIAAWERDRGSVVAAQLAATPDDWDPELTAFVSALTADDFAVSAEVDGCLDLVLVGTRR